MYSEERPEWCHNPNLTFQERILALRALYRGRDGPPEKLINEEVWEALLPQLVAHGYMLRPRYREGWKPSWNSPIDTIGDHIEDALVAQHLNFMDAERTRDHVTIGMKLTLAETPEAKIASYLSKQSDPRNRCVPILDVFTVDDAGYDAIILVMPILRKFDDPPFETVGDCMSFVHQMLEGICFIHEHGVAHRDCTGANIMMYATPLFPDGWHPQAPRRSRDAKRAAVAKSRRSLTAPIKDYYADWGLSSRHPLNDPDSRVVGTLGKDKRLPELSEDIPYNPFKLDIHILGGLFSDAILMKTSSLDFLSPLVQAMTRDVPEERPSACEAFRIFEKIQAFVTPRQRRSRLKPREPENIATDVFFNSVDTIREALYMAWKFFGYKYD